MPSNSSISKMCQNTKIPTFLLQNAAHKNSRLLKTIPEIDLVSSRRAASWLSTSPASSKTRSYLFKLEVVLVLVVDDVRGREGQEKHKPIGQRFWTRRHAAGHFRTKILTIPDMFKPPTSESKQKTSLWWHSHPVHSKLISKKCKYIRRVNTQRRAQKWHFKRNLQYC